MNSLPPEMRVRIVAYLSFEDRLRLARASPARFGFARPREPTVMAESEVAMRVRGGEAGPYLTATVSAAATLPSVAPGRGLLQVTATLRWHNEGDPSAQRDVVVQLWRGGAIIALSRDRYTSNAKSCGRRQYPLAPLSPFMEQYIYII